MFYCLYYSTFDPFSHSFSVLTNAMFRVVLLNSLEIESENIYVFTERERKVTTIDEIMIL